MKKSFTAYSLLLAVLFAACADFQIENPEQESPNVTRAAADIGGKDYYWSGGRKIYLYTNYTKMIVGFDSEEELKTFAVNISKENPLALTAPLPPLHKLPELWS